MPEIEVRDRTVTRAMALLPALVIAVCVRVLTLGTPPLALRLVAAGVIALCCWTSYRLLTASVTVTDAGVRVRGVMYDADVPWDDLHAVNVQPAGAAVRFLLWGMIAPRSVTLVCNGRILRPIGMLSGADDDDVDRAVGAMRVRCGVWRVPVQRTPADEGVSIR